MEGQQVDFVTILECAELDTCDYANAQPLARFARCGNSTDRVVVSECECLQSAARGSLDHLLG
jgi:hypothetical protein